MHTGTSGTLPAISGIFFLYYFLVRDPGKQVQSAGCAGRDFSHRQITIAMRKNEYKIIEKNNSK
jgi:hypothetical protein